MWRGRANFWITSSTIIVKNQAIRRGRAEGTIPLGPREPRRELWQHSSRTRGRTAQRDQRWCQFSTGTLQDQRRLGLMTVHGLSSIWMFGTFRGNIDIVVTASSSLFSSRENIFRGICVSSTRLSSWLMWLTGAPASRINNGGHCASHQTLRVFKYSMVGLCPRLHKWLGVVAALARAAPNSGYMTLDDVVTRVHAAVWRLSLGRRPIVLILCCVLVYIIFIVIIYVLWWFVRVHCAHGLNIHECLMIREQCWTGSRDVAAILKQLQHIF